MEAEKLYDLQQFSDIASGDAARIRDFVNMFIDTANGYAEQMTKASDESSWTMVSSIAHKMVSAYGYIGAHRLCMDARSIERDLQAYDDAQKRAKIASLCRSSRALVDTLIVDFKIDR